MWESLATTRRQDRVLHGFAKAANVVIGVLAAPLWLIGQRLSRPLRRALARLDDGEAALPVPPPAERSMDALLGDLQAIPHRLHPSRTAELRKGISDFAPFVLGQHRYAVGIGYSYPRQFRYDHFEGADGERIAMQVALHESPRPGLIVVHGLFSNRLFDYVREIAVRAFFDWGFDVAAIDLRSFGATELMSHAPSTAGWKEGEDIARAALYLKQLGATSVGALGISLGSSSVLNAAHLPEAADGLDGGILAICGPADTRKAAERLSRKLPWRHPAYLINRMFGAMLTSRVRSGRWPESINRLTDPIETISAAYYEVPAETIWERSSAKNTIAGARIPVLALHSEDDLIIPVEHARMLADAAQGNPNVGVWIVPGGAHAAFDALDERWAYAVYRAYFERWATYAERAELDSGGQPAGELAPASR
jgi:predicted alpha/beta-fold hydrolase